MTTTPGTLVELVDENAPKPRNKDRRQGFDPVIETMFADHKAAPSPVKMYAQVVTRLELVRQNLTADSGEELKSVQCLENIGYLITVQGWDTLADKDAFKKQRIIPAVKQLKSKDPKRAVVVQYLDRNGTVMDDLPTVLKEKGG